MPEKSYQQINAEIGQLVEKLEGIELQASSVHQEIAKLLSQRQAIEAGWGSAPARSARTVRDHVRRRPHVGYRPN